MVETHPFGNFVPRMSVFVFGNFYWKDSDPSYDWFFGTKRNQFWPILESAFGVELKTKTYKQELFSKLKMAITDIILQCERSENTNADNNLINIVYNTDAIVKIIEKNKISAIFFSSRMTENYLREISRNLY